MRNPILSICFSIFFYFLFSFHFTHNNSSINTPKALPTASSSVFTYLSFSISQSHQRNQSLFRRSSLTKSGMSRRTSKQVGFSPDVNDRPTIFLKHGGSGRTRGNRKRVVGIFTFRLVKSSFSPARLLSRLGAKVARALRFVSVRRNSCRKVSSSHLPRSRSLAESIESHRAEAIEDCIEFLNSSSSLSRSNSVSTCSC